MKNNNPLTINSGRHYPAYMIKYCLLIFLACPLFGPLFGKETLTLADAIQKGLNNNFEIRIARQEEARARNNNSWAVAGAWPTLNLGIDQKNSHNRFTYSPGSGEDLFKDNYNTITYSPYVSLNWTLFDGFGVQITKKKLAYLQEISAGNSAVIVENTIQAIVLAYYNALLEKERRAVLKEVTALSKDRYDYMTRNKEIGNSGTYDVLQSEIAYLDDHANLMQQEANHDTSLRSLNLLMGQPMDAEYQLNTPFDAKMEQYSLKDLIAKLKLHNNTLKNQYINQFILKKDVSLQKSSRYPVLSFSSGFRGVQGEVKFPGFPGATRNSYEYYANFSLSLNLFNGGKTRRAIADAGIKERIGSIRITQMERSLKNLLYNALAAYNIKKQLYTIACRSRESASLSLEISTAKVKSGAIDSFEYRDVQIAYLNAAFRKLQAIYDLIESHSELLRLTGGIIVQYK
jgi:outer membrane protein TolC